ncbi:Transposase [Hordeum vulgare]|nr:Transposase [Hordeum vulgare]
MRKMKCGRKKINLDIDALEAIPTSERTTLRQLAEAINMPTTTVFRRKRGEWEIKPSTEVDKAKSREYLINFVLPAIKAKWSASDRYKTVYIQQDNARTHIQPMILHLSWRPLKEDWDIKMVFQPPNSPDTNILDLGWFASIQSLFQKKMPKTLAEILAKVNQSLAEYPHEKLNRIFLSHQACMREIIRKKGTIHYDVPHLKKKVLEKEGRLPIRLTIDKDFVDEAIEWLNADPIV